MFRLSGRHSGRRLTRRYALAIEPLEARAMLAAYPDFDELAAAGPSDPPPANTPIGSFGANCAASFFAPPPDSPIAEAPAADAPLAAAAPAPAGAPSLEIFVTITADEDDGDRSLDDISLREAILIANAGNADATIHVPLGTYFLTRSGRGENAGSIGDLDVSNPGHTTRILGASRAATFIRNSGDDRIFQIHGGSTVEIRGLSIEDGIEPNGGGVFNAGNLTLVDVLVRHNFGNTTGGGVANAPGAMLAIDSSTITENSSKYGGGVINNVSGSLTITNSTISGNFALSAGGILNQGGTLQLTASSVSNNSASESGGGVVNLSVATAATATLNGSFVTNNRVTNLMLGSSLAQGGGICNAADGGASIATLSIIGGSVSGNRATAGNLEQVTDAGAQGGGIYNRATSGNARATVTLQGVSLGGNLATASATATAASAGGAAYNRAESGQAMATFSASDGTANGNSVSSLVGGGVGAIGPKSAAQGGAFYNRARMDSAIATLSAASLSLENNAAVANSVDIAEVQADGGAIFNESGVVSASAPTAKANLNVVG
ncbi:MAG: CSLREA domain-containing protein, partial [Pirellulales bacterium]